MKKYSCKGSFLPLIRKEVRRREKKTNTGARGMPSLSWEENQRRTIIFQETINASPFWIRQMTARTARSWASPEQTGAGCEMPPMVLWSGDSAPGDRTRLICRRTEPLSLLTPGSLSPGPLTQLPEAAMKYRLIIEFPLILFIPSPAPRTPLRAPPCFPAPLGWALGSVGMVPFPAHS